MDSKDHDEEELSKIIKEWLEISTLHLATENFITTHIDELLKQPVPPTDFIHLSIKLFEILVNQVQEMGISAKPVVVLQLVGGRNKLQGNAPADLVELEKELDTFTPPILYLVNWEIKVRVSYEAYITPLKFNLINNKANQFYTFYQESRGDISIKNNWEFSRTVTIEFYPGGVKSLP